MTCLPIERTEPVANDERPLLVDRLRRFRTLIAPIYAVSPSIPIEAHRAGLYDLDLVMQLLNLREWADWLRVHGDAMQARFGDEVHQLLDEADATDVMLGEIERVVPVGEEQPYADAVEAVAAKAICYDTVRAVLVNAGALDANDKDTDVAALIRALLS